MFLKMLPVQPPHRNTSNSSIPPGSSRYPCFEKLPYFSAALRRARAQQPLLKPVSTLLLRLRELSWQGKSKSCPGNALLSLIFAIIDSTSAMYYSYLGNTEKPRAVLCVTLRHQPVTKWRSKSSEVRNRIVALVWGALNPNNKGTLL